MPPLPTPKPPKYKCLVSPTKETHHAWGVRPRSLIGMTQGARKRAARWAYSPSGKFTRRALRSLGYDPHKTTTYSDEAAYQQGWELGMRQWTEARSWMRLGQRLRLCVGCAKCHPKRRSWRKVGGFPRRYPGDFKDYLRREWARFLLWDGATMWIHSHAGEPKEVTCYSPSICDGMVDTGSWERIECDGSGVVACADG